MINPISWLLGRASSPDIASPMAGPSHLEAVTWGHLLDTDIAKTPTRQVALTVPAVVKARSAICSTVARVPLIAHDRRGPLDPQPSIITQPDPTRTRSTILAWIADQMLFYGVAWLLADSAEYADRTQLHPIDATRVTISDTGRALIDRVDYGDRLIRIDALNPGLLETGAEAISIARALAQGTAMAAQTPVPSLILTQTSQTNLTQPVVEQTVAAWRAARAKPGGTVGFIPYGLSADVLTQPESSLLIGGRAAQAVEIARLAGVPSWVLDAEGSESALTYATVTGRIQELLEFGVAPYLTAIQERLSMDDILPRGQWVVADTSGLVKGDLATRSAAYLAAQTAGIMTADECRAAEHGTMPE